MIDHWQSIIVATVVASVAVLTRYLFVMKKDCKDHRDGCISNVCKKIDSLKEAAVVTTEKAMIFDRCKDAVQNRHVL